MGRAIYKRSVIVAGHRSSVSLEAEFWEVLKEIAASRAVSINELVSEVDRNRDGNLSSALRLYVLATLRQRLASGAPVVPASAAGAAPAPVEGPSGT